MQDDKLNDNLKFEKTAIQFFPEDIEKMAKMTSEEKIEFKHLLKKERRYVVINK